METAVPVGRPRTVARMAFLGGALYVVLIVIGTILLFSGAPSSGAAPAKVIQWYSDSGHRDRINIGWVVTGLGVFFFLWFLSALRRSVRLLEGDDGFLTGLTTVGGAIYASLTLAAIAVDTGIRTMSDDTYHHTVYPGLIHAADDAGWVLHASGGVGLVKTRVTDLDQFVGEIDSTDFGFNVGGGIMGFFNDNVGIRGDIRFFRSLRDADINGLDIELGGFKFWRGTLGVTFKF